MRWRPIKTAPKDGTYIRIYAEGEVPPEQVTHWYDGNDAFGHKVQGFVGADCGELGPYLIEPTHWKPCDPPPRGIRRGKTTSKSS